MKTGTRYRAAVAALVATAALTLLPSGTLAERRSLPVTHQRLAVTFRLAVHGNPPAHTTYWVAWGPLGGHFGIVRLHHAGPGMFTATERLPRGRTTFAYLAGTGIIRTRAGLAPGNPVVTIRVTRPLQVQQGRFPVVNWYVPAG